MENREDKFNDDLLRKFLNPGKIRKAPEGFSVKTMTRIRIEVHQPVKGLKGFIVNNSVPLVSVLVIAGLLVAATLMPSQGTDNYLNLIWNYLQDIKITLPQLRASDLPAMTMPAWLPYAILMVIAFAVFDRFLFRVFHKSGK
jgi:hypothetical protein